MDGTAAMTGLGGHLDLDTAYEIADGAREAKIAPLARERVAAASARVAQIIEERRHVYGITTGFGPLADRLIDATEAETLQQNLVYHLASGVGPPLPWLEARAMVLARLNSILQGASGASDACVDALVSVLNGPYAPLVPQKGTVGASGDLTPLAHMAICLQGTGDFLRRTGETVPGPEALADMGCAPLHLGNRDGLALVNGTSAMTGIAVINAHSAERAVDWAIALSAALGEVMNARREAWDPAFSNLRRHPGQAEACAALNSRITGSTRLTDVPLVAAQVAPGVTGDVTRIGQDAYTFRCVPQVIGAVIDSVGSHRACVEIELNSVTDNPVLPLGGTPLALHGGNFMGTHVALVSDGLGTAITVLAGLAERQLARLTDESLNGGLPAFLSRAQTGLSSGFMGAQVTATALLAERRTIVPASAHSISTNAANQDVVSMGTIAARRTRERLDMCQQILAILALAVTQAMDIKRESGGFSANARALRDFVRQRAPEMHDDRPLGTEISALACEIARRSPPGA